MEANGAPRWEVIPDLSNQCARRKTGRASKAVLASKVVKNGRQAEFSRAEKGARSTHETADGYSRVVTHLCDGWRMIFCKDNNQWILQRRKKGGAERPWRADPRTTVPATFPSAPRLILTALGEVPPRETAWAAAN